MAKYEFLSQGIDSNYFQGQVLKICHLLSNLFPLQLRWLVVTPKKKKRVYIEAQLDEVIYS